MSYSADPESVFYRLVGGVADRRWDDLADLYSEDAVVHHPFSDDSSAVLNGRHELREHFRSMGERGLEMSAQNVLVHETTDPEVIVAEFEYHGHSSGGGGFVLPAVFVLRVRDGLIVESRDYLGSRRNRTSQP